MTTYTGYVYIWFDTKAKLFYIGGHFGKVEDSYICSNKPMKRAYKKRPETFRFRVLELVNGDTKSLRLAEQKWLDKIKDSELMLTENVQNGTCRYYNVKKNAYGGSHKGHIKNRKIPAWNKGYTVKEQQLRKLGLCCFIPLDIPAIKNTKKPKMKKVKKITNSTMHHLTCQCCGIKFTTTYKNQKVCSRSCAGKLVWLCNKGKGNFKKGHIPWNKGSLNPQSSENGRKGAKKQSETVKGRRLATRHDGTRYWVYPEKNGEIE